MTYRRKTQSIYHVRVGRTLNPADRREVEIATDKTLSVVVASWARRGYFVDSFVEYVPVVHESEQLPLGLM